MKKIAKMVRISKERAWNGERIGVSRKCVLYSSGISMICPPNDDGADVG